MRERFDIFCCTPDSSSATWRFISESSILASSLCESSESLSLIYEAMAYVGWELECTCCWNFANFDSFTGFIYFFIPLD